MIGLQRLHMGHAILAALALTALLLAMRAWAALVAPVPAMPAIAPPQLTDRPLLARFDPFFRSGASGAELPVTALPFSLHGLRTDSATGRGSAIIAAGDGQQSVFSVGEEVGQGVTLVAIAVDHVVLDRGGTRETLWLDSAGAAAVGTFTPPDMRADTLDQLLPGQSSALQLPRGLSPEAEIDAMMARGNTAPPPDPLQPEQGEAMLPAAAPEPQ